MNINYITISDLTRYIKAKFDFDSHLQKVYIKGQLQHNRIPDPMQCELNRLKYEVKELKEQLAKKE